MTTSAAWIIWGILVSIVVIVLWAIGTVIFE